MSQTLHNGALVGGIIRHEITQQPKHYNPPSQRWRVVDNHLSWCSMIASDQLTTLPRVNLKQWRGERCKLSPASQRSMRAPYTVRDSKEIGLFVISVEVSLFE